mgnify:CR=1 FL=1|jgi:methionyl-tRNA formyltransferase
MNDVNRIKLAIFCDDVFGLNILDYIESKKIMIDIIVYNSNNIKIRDIILKKYKDIKIIESNKLYYKANIKIFNNFNIDIILLAWWPYIIKEPILSLPHKYIINMHPSYLPHGRGKHPYFWNIVEKTKFGVSLHIVNKNIDEGSIIARDVIDVGWEDNGFTLREKSRKKLFNLFKKNFFNIIKGKINFIKTSHKSRLHLSNEIEKKSKIFLEKKYKAKDLINLIRARSGFETGGAWFKDKNNKYEIKTIIRKKK